MTRLLLAAALALSPVPASARDLVLICYLRQFASGAAIDFIRRLDFEPGGTVGIADDLGSGFQYLGRARLLRSDKLVIAFDFASPLSAGRTQIDRRTGAFHYSGEAFTSISGTCSVSPT